MVTIAGVFIRQRRLHRHIPWLVGTMISAQAIAFATRSGGSVSPARQFGPAVMAGDGLTGAKVNRIAQDLAQAGDVVATAAAEFSGRRGVRPGGHREHPAGPASHPP
ncbi:aquaporin [Streptomyces niphimycinicus]|uniref:aquaporin n=1 Tax=Streptomyces niphimycinicus TaxID=2842201 RepID=UPI00209AB860|nr:aquaporin [Streptomyces niphimycinicus]